MKKSIIVLTLIMLVFSACTSNDEGNDCQSKEEALSAYDMAFKSNIGYMMSSRSVINDAEDASSDSLMALLGRELCANLEVSSNVLLSEFGLTDQLLLETYKEHEASFCNATTFEEYKCFTALTIYDAYKASTHQMYSRADAYDIAGCIVLGTGYKDLVNAGTKQIAKLAAKKLASRLVPYIGWGWGVASAATCIANL